jgi:protein-disulfide isomerase
MICRARLAVSLAVVALVALVALAGPSRADPLAFDPAAIYRVPRGAAPASGPVDAPVTIVAWSDYTCAYCNRVQPTLDQLARLYPGQLRWVHRTLPLDEDNTLASEAALAAGAQGRFLPMNDRLYALGGRVDREAVELIARELGLDMVRFRADLDTRRYRPAIDADAADAQRLGVTGTPTFFVNGRPVHGNQPLRVFAGVVDQELARAAERAGGASYDALVGDGRLRADTPSAPGQRFELDRTALYRVGLGLPGHQSGPDDALVTIVEWSDFQCPFCARQAPVLAELREHYKNQVRVVYRHLAMGFHRDAALAAEAGVAAAAQGKFWAFHDQVFANFGHLTRGDLEQFARAAGLDMPAFRTALDDRRYHDAITAEAASAAALGVDGTPTMFINGAPVGGARDAQTMERLVESHLARAREVLKAGVAPADLYAVLMTAAQGDERADPSRVPAAIRLALRTADRARAVEAACRQRDPVRAAEFASGLTGEVRRRAQQVCTGVGVDLPHE